MTTTAKSTNGLTPKQVDVLCLIHRLGGQVHSAATRGGVWIIRADATELSVTPLIREPLLRGGFIERRIANSVQMVVLTDAGRAIAEAETLKSARARPVRIRIDDADVRLTATAHAALLDIARRERVLWDSEAKCWEGGHSVADVRTLARTLAVSVIPGMVAEITAIGMEAVR